MSTLLNLQGYSLHPQKYWFSFENLSKETESGSFQKVPDQEKCITFLSRFTAFYIRLENVDNLQDMSSMAPRCMGTDVVTLSLEVSSTKIWQSQQKRKSQLEQKRKYSAEVHADKITQQHNGHFPRRREIQKFQQA